MLIEQIIRTKRLQAAFRKAESTFPRENAPKAEDIRNLGLLGKESESAKVLGLE
jgi:NADH dehydrogenase (ubiquinone) Fe-S protein 5